MANDVTGAPIDVQINVKRSPNKTQSLHFDDSEIHHD